MLTWEQEARIKMQHGSRIPTIVNMLYILQLEVWWPSLPEDAGKVGQGLFTIYHRHCNLPAVFSQQLKNRMQDNNDEVAGV